MKQLVFNPDGTLDLAQLEGMPAEFIERVQSPEFIAHAKQQIELIERGRRMRAQAHLEAQARRPEGVSGRQRVRLRRLVRKIARARLASEGGNKCS